MARLSLVTGGSGFIGRSVVAELANRGDKVRIFDLAEPKEDHPQVDFVRGSILDQSALVAALDGVDLLFHIAGIPDLWISDKRQFYLVNAVGTRHVLAAAQNAKLERLVFTSTESIVRGTAKRFGHSLATEEFAATLADMPGPYCRSKFLAERMALDAAADGLPVVVVNPTLPIGAGDERLTPPTRMLLGYLNGDYPAYLETQFNLIHVRDVAQGHILAAERGRIGERYILGGENKRLSEVLEILHEMTGLNMPSVRVPYPIAYLSGAVGEFIADHITRRPPDAPLTGVRLAARPMIFDTTKAREELGLSITPLRHAISEAIQWFSSCGLLRRLPKTTTEALAAE